jgi:hypothetical protein
MEIAIRMPESSVDHLLQVTLTSSRGINYAPLRDLLSQQQWQEADSLTRLLMCEVAGELAVKRGWLYFTEMDRFPREDLQTLDQLWVTASKQHFGFSVQRALWLKVGRDWDKLWPLLGWKQGISWTRYPEGFTWDLSAPKGHLPLSNQLRGVQVFSSLLSHPLWTV